MNQKLQPEQIRQLLDGSLDQIGEPALARLREARELALTRHNARLASPLYALAGNWHFGGIYRGFRYFAAAAVFAAVLISGAAYWQHEHEAVEVDVAILTDELPIEVYVD
jgi:hypothetical protein